MIKLINEINPWNKALHAQITFFGKFVIHIHVELDSWRTEIGVQNQVHFGSTEPNYSFRLNLPYCFYIVSFSSMKKDGEGYLWCSFWAFFFMSFQALVTLLLIIKIIQ